MHTNLVSCHFGCFQERQTMSHDNLKAVHRVFFMLVLLLKVPKKTLDKLFVNFHLRRERERERNFMHELRNQ